MPQPCARMAHRQPPTEQYSTIVSRIYPIQMYIHNCWQNISNTDICLRTCTCFNLVLEWHTDTPQLNNTQQLLAEHFPYYIYLLTSLY